MSVGVMVAVGTAAFEPALLDAVVGPQRHVVRRCVDVADLVATAASRQARLAVVAAELGGLDAETVARLREEEVTVVGVTAEAASADEALLRQIGITWIATAEDLLSLGELLDSAARDPAPVPSASPASSAESGRPPDRQGRVIAVWGPTGAPGRSTVAVNLSAELARLRAATLLVDADVYGGAVAAMLGILDESSGLLAAARAANVGALDPARLARHAREVDPWLRVLTGIPRADRWTEVKSVLLRSVLTTARSLASFTVVDCGFSLELDEEISYDTAAPRRNGATVAALEHADVVVVVGSADPVGLSRLIRALTELSTVVPSVSPYVVVNRLRPSLGWDSSEVAQMLYRSAGVEHLRTLPADPAACDRALVTGQSLVECAPQAKLARAFREMASDLAGPPAGHNRRRAARVRR